jgi:hypothetical protein
MTYKWTLPTIETHGRIPTEDEEQKDLVMHFRKKHPDVLIHSVPNEGKRSSGTGNTLKAMGMEPGMPDLHIPEYGLWVELKTQDGGNKGTKEQLAIHEKLRAIGDDVFICWGSAEAQLCIDLHRRGALIKMDERGRFLGEDFPGCNLDPTSKPA